MGARRHRRRRRPSTAGAGADRRSPGVREQAAWALGAIGDSRALPVCSWRSRTTTSASAVRQRGRSARSANRRLRHAGRTSISKEHVRMSVNLQDLRLGLRLLIRSPLSARRDSRAGHRHRRQYRNLQRHQHAAHPAAALPRRRSPRRRLGAQPAARNGRTNVVGPANFLHWREMNHVFEDLAAITFSYSVTVTGSGEPEELQAQSISAELFPDPRRAAGDRSRIHSR